MTLAEFVDSLDASRCRIINPPRIIFLCGGKASFNYVRAENRPDFESARDYLVQYLWDHHNPLARRTKLAEQLTENWGDRGLFDDLLALEEQIAWLADAIVVIVESPGAVAELGAFIALPHLIDRTVPVLNSKYYDKSSFITEGIIRRWEMKTGEEALYFHWNDEDLNRPETLKDLEDASRELSSLLLTRQAAAPKSKRFDSTDRGHVMLLIAQLIKLNGLMEPPDLVESLKRFSTDIDSTGLSQMLLVLTRLGIIERSKRGNYEYYTRKGQDELIHFAFNDEALERDLTVIKVALRRDLVQRDEKWKRTLEKIILAESAEDTSHE